MKNKIHWSLFVSSILSIGFWFGNGSESHAQSHLDNSVIQVDEGYDDQKGMKFQGPFLVQSSGPKSLVFALGESDKLDINESVRFLVIVDDVSEKRVATSHEFSVFATRLLIGSRYLVGNTKILDSTFELEVDDFEKREFTEKVRFFPTKRDNDQPVEFELKSGRIFFVGVESNTVVCIRQSNWQFDFLKLKQLIVDVPSESIELSEVLTLAYDAIEREKESRGNIKTLENIWCREQETGQQEETGRTETETSPVNENDQ